ncbi:MAG: tRNA dihydrouridine synthase DusB [Actinobacteria bacterium]|nr:tRNA dihydrouridine synthase DusB [Actinomycetota bacterium]
MTNQTASPVVAAKPLQLGEHSVWPPVVLAPMAGVTNQPFRTLCREFGPGLVYVNEMVMAAALVHENPKTEAMIAFGPDESFRSLQLYGSDPKIMTDAITQLGRRHAVDHIDLNFGCPAPKVTRRGGGAAVPVKKNLLREIVEAAVKTAGSFGIPVTCKFRIGLNDDLLTHVHTGLICQDAGVAAIALHARTAQQHYAPFARWEAIAELKDAVTEIPVFGNGDIWEANDALLMMRQTNCDGVVIGRGCLGKPWLFRDIIAVFNNEPIPATPKLGWVTDVMLRHAVALEAHFPATRGIREFRKHAGWYLTGYPVGGELRRQFGEVSSIDQLRRLIDQCDPAASIVEGGERFVRGHSNGPVNIVLPHGFLQSLDDLVAPDDATLTYMSGG